MYLLKTKNYKLNTSFPMNPHLTDDEIEYIVGSI